MALCRGAKWLSTTRDIPKRETRDPQIGVICLRSAQNLLKSNFRSLPRSAASFSHPGKYEPDKAGFPTLPQKVFL